MASVFLVSDIHFGRSKDSEIYAAECKSFFDDVFFPELERCKDPAKCVIIAGDLMDNRQATFVQTMYRVKDVLLNRLNDLGVPTFIILGNHDICYKNTLSINSVRFLVDNYAKINVVDNYTTLKMGGINIDMCPWICDDNTNDIMTELKNSKSEILVGHFEVNGAQYSPGLKAKSSFTYSMVKNFRHVYSGHFHYRSNKGNFQYLGSPYQQDRSESSQQKGFFIININDGLISKRFVKNPSFLYHKIIMIDNIYKEQKPGYYLQKIVDIIPDDLTDQSVISELVENIENDGAWVVSVQTTKKNIDITETKVSTQKHHLTDYIVDHLKNANTDIGISKTMLQTMFNDSIQEINN